MCCGRVDTCRNSTRQQKFYYKTQNCVASLRWAPAPKPHKQSCSPRTMTAALGSHLAALALDGGWGNRPRGPPPAPELRAGVLLNQDHQAAILDVLGVRGSHLAALCRSWRVAVAERLGT